MRDEYLKKFDSKKTLKKYHVIFRKFDDFLARNAMTEQDFISRLHDDQTHTRYNVLQNMVYFLSESLSPRSTHNYFDSLFNYFLFVGCPLDYTQKKLRVKFPRNMLRRPDGLDRDGIVRLLSFADRRMSLYMRVLAGSGLREDEALQLKPSLIQFDLFRQKKPARVDVISEIAKLGIAHETFIPYNTSMDLFRYITDCSISAEQHIFTDHYTIDSVSKIGHEFEPIRRKAGLDTGDRRKHQKNDIRLHSLRAWFITTWTDLGFESFGNALAGHTKYLSTYYRKSPEARQEQFSKYQGRFEFNSVGAVPDLHGSITPGLS